MSLLGQWSGQSLICTGDESSPGDYPPGMFTEEEEVEFSQYKYEDGEAKNLYDIAEDGFVGIHCGLGERISKNLDSKLSMDCARWSLKFSHLQW